MIKFTSKDDNKQFISILVKDNTLTENIYNYLSNLYKPLTFVFYKMDDEEIIFRLESDIKYGFSLCELRQAANKIAEAVVTHFCVDVTLANQRYS